jgi:hemolysin activation/secretion protein
VNEGILGAVDAGLRFSMPGSGTGDVSGTLGRLGDRTFGTGLATARWALRGTNRSWVLDLDASAGAVSHEAPAQDLFLLGGLGTLPGYPFRSFVGDAFGLAQVQATLPLLPPWVGIRGIASLGYTHLTPGRILPPGWNAHDSDGLRPSAGVGLSLAWDVLRLDLARGLRGGHWQLVFSVDPRFGPWL